jgi:hypothetical protein
MTKQATLLFTHTTTWWDKILPGYTHVCLMMHESEEDENGMVKITYCDPLTRKSFMSPGCIYLESMTSLLLPKRAMITITYKPNRVNLIRPVQTCATIVQYLLGINLGATTVNSLYNKLTTKHLNWLAKKGITGVKIWQRSLQPQPSGTSSPEEVSPSAPIAPSQIRKMQRNKPKHTGQILPLRALRTQKSKPNLTETSSDLNNEPPLD